MYVPLCVFVTFIYIIRIAMQGAVESYGTNVYFTTSFLNDAMLYRLLNESKNDIYRSYRSKLSTNFMYFAISYYYILLYNRQCSAQIYRNCVYLRVIFIEWRHMIAKRVRAYLLCIYNTYIVLVSFFTPHYMNRMSRPVFRLRLVLG